MLNSYLPKNKNLFPFQQEGIDFLLNSPSRHLYLADDMGLGKTVQGICFLNAINAKNVLIVVPASLRLNWVRELEEWLVNKRLSIKAFLHGSCLNKLSFHPNILVTSYDLLAHNLRVRNYVDSRAWDLMILDEAQAIRGTTSKRTSVVLKLWLKMPRVLAMSGTPMMNSAIDLFPPLSRIVPYLNHVTTTDKELYTNFKSFSDTFTYQFTSSYGINFKGVKNSEKLKKFIREDGGFFIRREKEDVLKDLPNKVYNRFDLPIKVDTLVGSVQEEYMLNHFLLESEEEKNLDQMKKHFASIRRELGEAKALSKLTYEIIDQLVEGSVNNCLVVFFFHKNVRDILHLELKKKGYCVVIHDGHTSNLQKQANVDAFQKGEANIFLAQSEAASGYTVTRANDCLFIEYPWLPTQLSQAVDRIHRIGQVNSVTAHFLVADNKLDKGLVKMLIEKQRAVDKVVNNE
jgi:SNF2 family DNA or RNA helicase